VIFEEKLQPKERVATSFLAIAVLSKILVFREDLTKKLEEMLGKWL